MAALVFSALCVGAALAFGPGLQINVLSNLSIDSMAPLLGAAPAVVASLVIQIGYVVSLMASFLLYMHPMRTNVAEMIWPPPDVAAGQGAAPAGRRGSDDEGGGGAGVEAGAAAAGVGAGRAAEMEARHYHVLTYSLLAAATLAAVSVPNIWAALSFIGNMCASVEAFIAPGCIALALNGFWPGSKSSGGGSSGGGGGGAEAARDTEAAPLLDSAAGSGAVGRAGSSGGRRRSGPGGAAAAWRAAAVAGNVATAVVAIALGCGLMVNGVAQQLVSWGAFG
ncbi:hypothetical protein MNEG_12273 [Monoraphidium neglectum]|uniref:Amino acid transporter transmembrane domain-containing protein n=1 Tax=Monoraphidium neglectum TaxID=145388 RepID=A0A0D2KIT8_9CHLO|nr:hypothetical protein MNEG_12273 [Monoraphidium neglectum]KIY95688.1 hypothetical protein MNEG_12273 [Monoraphidium neglectum]|eukprot:XP_013894708.1 hypothetical protein MNEG_12273 [Monoraphidium neglectum]